MLRFLSSLFSSPTEQAGRLDDALIDAAIERAVDGTDSRIRLLRNYRKRLRAPVTAAAEHIIGLVDRLPAPIEIGKSTYSTDARIRAFFASVDHLDEVVGGFGMARSYLRHVSGSPPECVFGLLTMARLERTVFGMALENHQVRQDIQQVAVSFSDHRYVCPTAAEDETRWELKKRGYDFLVERALGRIAAAKSKRVELEGQRKLLAHKRKIMQAGHWGLDLESAAAEPVTTDVQALEAEIEATEQQLLALGADTGAIETSLDYLVDTLSQPAIWLSTRVATLHIDYRGIKIAANAGHATPVEILELYSGDALSRVALLGWIASSALRQRSSLFDKASRYLG
ncbi:MAG: hypothetical protein AMS22_13240 [Thiotrichales bacterium SG8_50]|nr:MAG: hypothetical protein AMS22_13240 [Thiotrichales bacterium SG8_50]